MARKPSVGPALGAAGLPVIRTTAPAAGPGSDADAGGQSPGTALSGHSEQRSADNPFMGRVDRLYIVLSSVHGLVRGENMELGKDADTGGQVCCLWRDAFVYTRARGVLDVLVCMCNACLGVLGHRAFAMLPSPASGSAVVQQAL